MPTLYVHRNLNRNCWSVLKRGKLQAHRKKLTLRDVEFRVRPGGRARSLREGRRNVHAFAVGTMSNRVPPIKPVLVRYNLKSGKFLDHDGHQIIGAKQVRFGLDGLVCAFSPPYAYPE